MIDMIEVVDMEHILTVGWNIFFSVALLPIDHGTKRVERSVYEGCF